MIRTNRRTALGLTGSALMAAMTGCTAASSLGGEAEPDASNAGSKQAKATPKLIGDGSTSDTGPQPHCQWPG